MATATGKISWGGVLIAVQPRIRLTTSFDQRSHTYQGYVLRVRSDVGGELRDVLVAVARLRTLGTNSALAIARAAKTSRFP
jgi:hypothetical protein